MTSTYDCPLGAGDTIQPITCSLSRVSECSTYIQWNIQFSSVQALSRVQLFLTPWTAAWQASLSITNPRSPPKLMSIESVMPSSHLILCHPLLLLPPISPSISFFSNESALRIRWPKYWSFSFSINPSNEQPGLISFRMDWLDLLAVQGTLKSLLQHHSSKASILRRSAFFTVQLSHPYIAAAAAKSLQSCPTLCDPIDGSPLGSPVPGFLQARTLEWVAISFSNAWKWKGKVKSLNRVRLFATPWNAAHQAPPSMGFSRQEYWGGVPSPSPTQPQKGTKVGHLYRREWTWKLSYRVK